MRVAEICPTCATYINATCIIYDGAYLSTLDVAPLTSLDEILGNINDTFTVPSGSGVPTDIPLYYGQLYLNSAGELYIGLSTSIPNWGLIGTIITTTTTTSTSSTTTTTTTTP